MTPSPTETAVHIVLCFHTFSLDWMWNGGLHPLKSDHRTYLCDGTISIDMHNWLKIAQFLTINRKSHCHDLSNYEIIFKVLYETDQLFCFILLLRCENKRVYACCSFSHSVLHIQVINATWEAGTSLSDQSKAKQVSVHCSLPFFLIVPFQVLQCIGQTEKVYHFTSFTDKHKAFRGTVCIGLQLHACPSTTGFYIHPA